MNVYTPCYRTSDRLQTFAILICTWYLYSYHFDESIRPNSVSAQILCEKDGRLQISEQLGRLTE